MCDACALCIVCNEQTIFGSTERRCWSNWNATISLFHYHRPYTFTHLHYSIYVSFSESWVSRAHKMVPKQRQRIILFTFDLWRHQLHSMRFQYQSNNSILWLKCPFWYIHIFGFPLTWGMRVYYIHSMCACIPSGSLKTMKLNSINSRDRRNHMQKERETRGARERWDRRIISKLCIYLFNYVR